MLRRYAHDVLELTPLAVERLRDLRAADPANNVLRVYVAGKSCCGVQYALAFDEGATAGDTTVELAGIPLAVDAASLPYVRGATIDFVDSLMGGGFMVRNPAATGGGCACGGGGH